MSGGSEEDVIARVEDGGGPLANVKSAILARTVAEAFLNVLTRTAKGETGSEVVLAKAASVLASPLTLESTAAGFVRQC